MGLGSEDRVCGPALGGASSTQAGRSLVGSGSEEPVGLRWEKPRAPRLGGALWARIQRSLSVGPGWVEPCGPGLRMEHTV